MMVEYPAKYPKELKLKRNIHTEFYIYFFIRVNNIHTIRLLYPDRIDHIAYELHEYQQH